MHYDECKLLEGAKRNHASHYYQKAIGAKAVYVQKFEDMPGHEVPEEARGRAAHALLKIGDTDLMISDTFPGTPHTIGNHAAVCILTDRIEEAKRMFEALQDGGQVTMPFQETFWSPGYGIVTDKFVVIFHISVEAGQHQK